jgi:hypothetical protein
MSSSSLQESQRPATRLAVEMVDMSTLRAKYATRPNDADILREQGASEARVLAEGGVHVISSDTSVAQLAEMIAKDPLRFALRWLNLEFQVRNQHERIERLEQRLSSGGAR